MAERTEIIRIKLDTEDYKLQIANREKDIQGHKKTLQALTAAIKENGQATEEQSKQQVELESTIRLLNKEQTEAKRTLDNLTKSQKANLDSNEQLRADLSILTQQYNKLSKEERDNTEIGKNLKAQIKSISDELKKNEGAVGDNRRSVGSYREAIGEATKDLTIFGVNVGQLSDDLKTKLNGAITITKNGFSSFNNLLKTSVIGLVVASLAGLVAYFKRTEEGVEKLERIISFLGGAFDVVIGRVSEFGKQIVDAFTNPVAIAEKLGNFIQLAFSNPKEALAQLRQGMKDAQIDMANLTGAAIANGRAMANITRATQDLEDAQNAALPGNEKLKGQIEQLILQAKERTKSEKERLAGLREAGKLEEQLTAQRLKFAEQERSLALRQEQLDRANKKLDPTTRSEAAVAAEVKYQQILNESALQRQAIANRESVFIKELNEERIKGQQEAIKRQLESEKASIQLRLVMAAKGSLDELGIREELLQKELEITLKTGELTKTQRLLAEAETNVAIITERSKFYGELKALDLLNPVELPEPPEDPMLKVYGERMNASKAAMDQEKANANRIKQFEADLARARIANAKSVTEGVMQEFDEQTLIYKAALKIKQAIAIAEQTMALPGILTINAETGAKIGAIAPPFSTPLGIAYTATMDALAIARIAKMVADLAGVKIGFYDGGYTTPGNPKEPARNLGPRFYTYHKSEYVTPHDVLAMPEGQYHTQKLEQLRLQKRGLRGIQSSNSYYTGGYTIPQPTRNAIAGGNLDPDVFAAKLARANAALPAPIARISEINKVNQNINRRDVKVNS